VDFRDFYKIVEAEQQKIGAPVGFDFLRQTIIDNVPDVQEVHVWRLVYHPARRQAHFMLFDDRSSAYEGEFLVADISYCAALEDDPAELLFALVKELMHVFDPAEARIDTRDKFIAFLKALQNTPLDGSNVSLQMESSARWMALLVFIPRPLREEIRAEITDGRALRIEVAQRLGLPEFAVEVALDDYYDVAYSTLVGD
jgi:hypothetical protein